MLDWIIWNDRRLRTSEKNQKFVFFIVQLQSLDSIFYQETHWKISKGWQGADREDGYWEA